MQREIVEEFCSDETLSMCFAPRGRKGLPKLFRSFLEIIEIPMISLSCVPFCFAAGSVLNKAPSGWRASEGGCESRKL